MVSSGVLFCLSLYIQSYLCQEGKEVTAERANRMQGAGSVLRTLTGSPYCINKSHRPTIIACREQQGCNC